MGLQSTLLDKYVEDDIKYKWIDAAVTLLWLKTYFEK